MSFEDSAREAAVSLDSWLRPRIAGLTTVGVGKRPGGDRYLVVYLSSYLRACDAKLLPEIWENFPVQTQLLSIAANGN